jgi:hypothetical protein
MYHLKFTFIKSWGMTTTRAFTKSMRVAFVVLQLVSAIVALSDDLEEEHRCSIYDAILKVKKVYCDVTFDQANKKINDEKFGLAARKESMRKCGRDLGLITNEEWAEKVSLAAVGEGMNEDAAFLQGLTRFNARRDQLVTLGLITNEEWAEKVSLAAVGKGMNEDAAFLQGLTRFNARRDQLVTLGLITNEEGQRRFHWLLSVKE